MVLQGGLPEVQCRTVWRWKDGDWISSFEFSLVSRRGDDMRWRGINLTKVEWLLIIVASVVLAACAVLWFGAGTVGDSSLCGLLP